MRLSYTEIWRAIDKLAMMQNLSVSALAIKAGLDPTTFNPSKRINASGRPRWPSTESIHKILQVTNTSAADFLSMSGGSGLTSSAVTMPLLNLPVGKHPSFFAATGEPKKNNAWDAIEFPGHIPPHAFALEVTDDAYLPYYKNGDRLIAAAGGIFRHGDRVVVALKSGDILLGIFARHSALNLELNLMNGNSMTIPNADISWLARILWATQ
jgi:phage repressor protein C with HTH and peptisase S24 domain